MMSDVADPSRNFIPIQEAVLCVDCEMIGTSTNDACPVCGSRSLFSLFRVLGGTLSGSKIPFEDESDSIRYGLEITLKIKEMTAKDLNEAIAAINRITLPARGCVLESFHINVDPLVEHDVEDRQKAA